jgi:hypothetical protein
MARPLDRCGGSAGLVFVDLVDATLLLPVELRRVNHTSSTNIDNFNDLPFSHLKIWRPCHKHP